MFHFKNLSISRKIIAASLVIIVSGIVSMGAIIYERSKSLQEKSATELLNAISGEYAGIIHATLAESLDIMKTLALVMQQYKQLPAESRRVFYDNLLQNTLKSNTTFLSVWTCWLPNALDGADENFVHTSASDATGRYIPYFSRKNGEIHPIPLEGYAQPGTGDYFLIPYHSEREAIIDPYMYSMEGRQVAVTSIAVPIFSEGKIVGVVGCDIELATLQAIINTLKPYGNGIAALFSNGGFIAAHFDPSRQGMQMRESEMDILGSATLVNQVADSIKRGENMAFTLPATSGPSMMLSFFSFPIGNTQTPWSLAVAAPLDTIMEPVNLMLRYTVIIGFSVLVLALIAMVVVGTNIAKPIKSLTVAASRVAGGELDTPLHVDQKDETGYLSQALITMVQTLKTKIAEADAKSAEAGEKAKQAQRAVEEATAAKAAAERARHDGMLAAANQLEQVVDIVSQASDNLARQIMKSEEGANQQATQIQETASSMDQMNATVLEVAQNAGQASELSAVTRQEAENGARVVQNSLQSIQSVQAQSVKLQEDMRALNDRAQDISQIMSVISDIADQTNLLALNAAIEAARAGEAGRGFAVVADEVRKLAEKTMESTAVVHNAITAIQGSAAQSMAQIEESAKTINEATRFAQQSGDSLTRIVSMTDSTADQVRVIATAAEEQSATSEEINRSINDINTISITTADSMHAAAQVVRSLAEQAKVLSTLLEEMKNS